MEQMTTVCPTDMMHAMQGRLFHKIIGRALTLLFTFFNYTAKSLTSQLRCVAKAQLLASGNGEDFAWDSFRG